MVAWKKLGLHGTRPDWRAPAEDSEVITGATRPRGELNCASRRDGRAYVLSYRKTRRGRCIVEKDLNTSII